MGNTMQPIAYLIGSRQAEIDLFCRLLPDEMRSAFRNAAADQRVKLSAVFGEAQVPAVSSGKALCIRTPLMPAGICLRAEAEDFAWQTAEDCAYVLWLSGWTGHFSETMKNYWKTAETYLKKQEQLRPVRFKTVLLPVDTKVAATDLAKPETERLALRKQLQDYLKNNNLSGIIEIAELPQDDPESLYELFSGGDGIFRTGISMMQDAMRKQFDSLEGSLDLLFSQNHELISEIKAPEHLTLLTDFSVVSGSVHVLQTAGKKFLEMKEWKQLLENLREWYCEKFSQLAFWNIEQDADAFKAHLIKTAEQALHFQIGDFACPKQEVEYQRLRAQKKVDIQFQNHISALLNSQLTAAAEQYIMQKKPIFIRK